jgi:glycosyltransferase involved in cell wall biosynthesis
MKNKKQEMKVGFDAKRAFQNNTGLGNYSRYLIDILTTYVPDFQYYLFAPKETEKYKVDSQNFIITPKDKSFRFLWRSWGIKKDLEEKQIHIFHGLSNEIPFGLKNTNVRTVVTIHDLIFLRFPNWYKLLDRLIYNFKFKYAAKNADRIIAISEKTKSDLVEFYDISPEKISVIYQNCHPRFGLKSELKYDVVERYKLKKKYIICVGTIEPRKNQINLAKAFDALKTDDVDLVIVGRGKEYKTELENYIKDKQNIHILGNVDNDELVALYQNAQFAVYISIFEGFGIPVLEALRAGVPVLAATGSCLEEAGGDAALYVNPEDISAITEQLKLLLEDKTLHQTLKNNATKHLEKFDDKKIAEQIHKLYSTL